MEEHHKAPVVCFRSFMREFHNTAAQELSAPTAGARSLLTMTQIMSGDSAQLVFWVTVVTPMVIVAIFLLYTAGKSTWLVQLRMTPGLGAPLPTTMTAINNGVTAEVSMSIPKYSIAIIFWFLIIASTHYLDSPSTNAIKCFVPGIDYDETWHKFFEVKRNPLQRLNKRAVYVWFGPCWRTFTSMVKYFVLFLDEKIRFVRARYGNLRLNSSFP